MFEALEDRRMLTVLAGATTFDFQQSEGGANGGGGADVVRVVQAGPMTLAEYVGAVVDDNNQVILTDIPGRMNGGAQVLGGIGGYNGAAIIGPTNISDTLPGGGNFGPDPVGTAWDEQNNRLTNLASTPTGDLYGINLTANNNDNGLVQVVQLNPATGAGNVRVRIGEATLGQDVAFPNVAMGAFAPMGEITDTAINPLTGDLYVLSRPNPAAQDNLLTVFDRVNGTAIAQTNLPDVNAARAGNLLSGGQAMAFQPDGTLWIFTPDYDSNLAADASGLDAGPPTNDTGGGGGGGGTIIPKTNLDPALVRVDGNINSLTFGQWSSDEAAPDPDLKRIVDSVDNFEKIIDLTALIWDPVAGLFYGATAEPVSVADQNAGGGGGNAGGTTTTPNWDLLRLPLNAFLGSQSIIGYFDVGAIGLGAAGGGGGGGGTNGGLEVHGFAFARDARDTQILVGIAHVLPQADANAPPPAPEGQLLSINRLAPDASVALCRQGSVVLANGIASFADPGETRPLLYTIVGTTMVRGSAVSLQTASDTGAPLVTEINGAAFNPVDPSRLYFVTTIGDTGAGTGTGTGGEFINSIDLLRPDGTAYDNISQLQNALKIGGQFQAQFSDGTNLQDLVVAGIAFDQINANTSNLIAIDRATGRVSGVLPVAAQVNTVNLGTPAFFGPGPVIAGQTQGGLGTVQGLIVLGGGVISRGGALLGNLAEDPNAREGAVWTTIVANGHVQLLRITLATNTGLLWGGLDPATEIGGLTYNPTLLNPLTGQPGTILATNPGNASGGDGTDPTLDRLLRLDPRLRAASVNIYQIYTAVSDDQSMTAIGQWPWDPNADPPIDGPLMTPYAGSTGDMRVVDAQQISADGTILVQPNDGTGIVFIGAKTLDLSQADPIDDLWAIMRGTLRDANGTPSTTGFGLIPFGNGTLEPGLVVGPATNGGGQNYGRFLIGGTLTGHADFSGSLDFMYVGWNVVGDTRGLIWGAQLLSNTDSPGDFVVGGDFREMITPDSVGTDDATALTALRYFTSPKFVVGGRLGEFNVHGDFAGTVDVVNDTQSPLPLDHLQSEVEVRDEPVGADADSANFAQFLVSTPEWYNDTPQTAQFLGTINSVDGNDVVDVQGVIDSRTNTVETTDWYAITLMAGQTVQFQVVGGPGFALMDPDGNIVASDTSNVDAAAYAGQPLQWKTVMPGTYRIRVSMGGVPPFPVPYILHIKAAPGDTYGMNIGLGAVTTTGAIFDANLIGSSFRVQNGDLGTLAAAGPLALVAGADVLMTEDQFETAAVPARDALQGAAVEVTLGNLRELVSLTATSIPALDVFSGAVGALVCSTGDMAINSAYAIPRSTDHDPVGTARQVAIGGEYQWVTAGGNLVANLLTNTSIGMVHASSLGALDANGNPTAPGFYVANADNTGRDGIIDLFDVAGDWGNTVNGGAGIMTGPGGNVRYMHVTGQLFRDPFFGFRNTDDITIYPAGQSVVLNDDSGTPVQITPTSPVPLGFGQTGPALAFRTYGVRGAGGVVIVNVQSQGGMTLSSTAYGSLATAEIGQLDALGAGTPLAIDAAGRPQLAAAGGPRVSVMIGGSAPIDVFQIVGGDIYQISNTSRATDSRRRVIDRGELVNVLATSIYTLSGGNIGIAKQSTELPLQSLFTRTNAFPFSLHRGPLIQAGNIGYISALGAVGNVEVTGNIGQLVADSDRKSTQGVLTDRVKVPYEGIVAPIHTGGAMVNVVVGQGMTSSGTGETLAFGGLFAGGDIGTVRSNGGDIYGDIVSNSSIGRIMLMQNASLISSDIMVTPDLTNSLENSGAFAAQQVAYNDNVTNTIGSIYMVGDTRRPGRAAPLEGGIIGCLISASKILNIRTIRSAGIFDSVIQTIGDNDRMNLMVDGYGIRDVAINTGWGVGNIVASGNGHHIAVTGFSAGLRKSETMAFDPFTGFPPNRTTDLHSYLGTTAARPYQPNDNNRAGITRSGVIAGLQVFGSRAATLIQGWRMTFSNQLGAYVPSDIHMANYVRTVRFSESMIDPQITTGRLDLLQTGRDLHSPNVHVSGPIGTIKIGGNYTVEPQNRTDAIEAQGPNGIIRRVAIGGLMDGDILASVGIGPHSVRNKTGKGQFFVDDRPIR